MSNNLNSLYTNHKSTASSNEALRVITGVKYCSDILKMVNNLTFFYDPNWISGDDSYSTLPIGFFYCKSFNETMSANASTKQLIFYNSGMSTDDKVVGDGLTSLIADNIILQPKQYQLEVLIPYTADMILDQYTSNLDALSKVMNFTLKGDSGNPENLVNTFRVLNPSIATLRVLLDVLCGTNVNVEGFATLFAGQNDYNKSSLNAMWEHRRIVRMKMWNGWSFKEVVITSLSIKKSGDFENFYEGSITCQEMPIMIAKPKTQMAVMLNKGGSLVQLMSNTVHERLKPILNKDAKSEVVK